MDFLTVWRRLAARRKRRDFRGLPVYLILTLPTLQIAAADDERLTVWRPTDILDIGEFWLQFANLSGLNRLNYQETIVDRRRSIGRVREVLPVWRPGRP